MSAKYFCDCCENEIQKDGLGRVRRKCGKITVEVLTAWQGVSNAGHLCADCIIEAVNSGKPIKDFP